MAALQERKEALEALLHSRVDELRHVCLQEAVSNASLWMDTRCLLTLVLRQRWAN